MSESFCQKIAAMPAAQLVEVKHQFLEAIRPYSTDRGVSFRWRDSCGGVQLDSYADPYNWAPFVRAVGISQN